MTDNNSEYCSECGQRVLIGDWPFCPHGRGVATVIPDAMDHTQINGCKTPIRFRSKSDRKAWLKANGYEEFVRHVPLPGSDKSPHTSDWSRGYDDYTANYKRELLERAFAQKASPPPDDVIHFRSFDERELTALDRKFNTKVS